MKYIRTKDGKIYEVVDLTKMGNYVVRVKWYGEDVDTTIVFRDETIKSADTIEELCDTLVVWEGKNLLTFITYNNVQMPRFKELVKKHILTIYGAIWTDKGLIFVAKMNEKGELELL